MNSFLFNLILILLCTFPAIEFSTEAFAGYARFSNIYQFFGVQVSRQAVVGSHSKSVVRSRRD